MNNHLKISKETQKWLNRFSMMVEYNVFQKGLQLFYNDYVIDFQIDKGTFTAQVDDGIETFAVEGHFNMKNDQPLLETIEVTCSCHQDNICTHSVSAVVQMIFVFELSNHKEEHVEPLPQTDIEKRIERLKNSLEQAPSNILNLNFTEVDIEISMNDVHRQLSKKLKEIL